MQTKIQWCDYSYSAWFGCTKVSPGCDHCYAEHDMDHRFHRVQWGPHGERDRKSEKTRNQPLSWNRTALKKFGRPARVFANHYSDWLDNRVPDEWRQDFARLIEATPNLTWMLLTKRPENMRRLSPWDCGDEPHNVWFGTTCEDQEHYEKRWPILRERAGNNTTFVSYEPALGPLNLNVGSSGGLPDWVICGGESRQGKAEPRYMDPAWAMDVMRYCEDYNVAFFMKQMTGKRPIPTKLMRREWPV